MFIKASAETIARQDEKCRAEFMDKLRGMEGVGLIIGVYHTTIILSNEFDYGILWVLGPYLRPCTVCRYGVKSTIKTPICKWCNHALLHPKDKAFATRPRKNYHP